MTLTRKQTGVLKGMVFGALTAIVIVVAGAWFNPFSFNETSDEIERLGMAIKSALLPALFLVIAVGRLARHRFFTPEDIDGGGLAQGSEQAKILQSVLQNTLEQFSIALVAYLAWAFIMPATWMSVVPLAAIAFAIGRILFFAGYKNGAPSRAVGFTLAFYPSLLMLACVVGYVVWRLVG